MKGEEFLLEVGNALADCQVIELQLKTYISLAFAKVHRKIEGKYPFNFDGAEYAKAPLEKLIGIFRKLSDNDDLVKRLNQFTEKRNFLAHKAIVNCMDDEGDLNEWQIAGAYPVINTIQRDAKFLIRALSVENSTLRFEIRLGLPLPPPGPDDIEG